MHIIDLQKLSRTRVGQIFLGVKGKLRPWPIISLLSKPHIPSGFDGKVVFSSSSLEQVETVL